MKSGLEQRGKVAVALILGVIAIIVLWTSLSGRPTQATPPAVSTAPTRIAAPPRTTTLQMRQRDRDRRNAVKDRSLDPTLRFDLLVGEKVEYSGGKRNIFSAETEPPPVAPIKTPPPPHCPDDADPRCAPPPPVCPGPDPRCPPPPIPLQFFGFASKPGEPKRIFLRTTDTNDIFVASEGEVVNRRYRVLRIMGSSVEVEDVLNSNKQVLPLTQGP